jgi:hypothetical protein
VVRVVAQSKIGTNFHANFINTLLTHADHLRKVTQNCYRPQTRIRYTRCVLLYTG